MRFDSDGKIATIREYFDTRLIHDLVLEHEANQKKGGGGVEGKVEKGAEEKGKKEVGGK